MVTLLCAIVVCRQMNCTPSYDLYAHRLPDNVCPVSVSLWSLQHMHLCPASLWWHIKGKGYKIKNSCHRKKFGTSRNGIKSLSFLAVQNSSIGDLVLWSVCLTELTIRVFTSLQSDPTHLWPLGHLIRVTRRHDLTKNLYIFQKSENFPKIWKVSGQVMSPRHSDNMSQGSHVSGIDPLLSVRSWMHLMF